MTKREVTNKYFPILIMKMKDPRDAMQYCHPWANGQIMGNLIDKMPDEKIAGLWDIIKRAKYKDDPMPTIREMREEMEKAH